ncbi:MAG: hypothetical protein ACO2Z9_06455 [Crocinitomicaceae bacterium]
MKFKINKRPPIAIKAIPSERWSLLVKFITVMPNAIASIANMILIRVVVMFV